MAEAKELVISKEMTMGEILKISPGARRALFQRYHVGGCSSCGFAETDTLEHVCKTHNMLDPEEVIEWLKQSAELDEKMQISPKQAAELLKSGKGFKLLDARTPGEYEFAKIDGARLLDQSVMYEIMSLPKDAPIVVYCHTGNRSMDVAAYLAGHGFTNVKSMSGGIDAWSQEVDPAIKRYEYSMAV